MKHINIDDSNTLFLKIIPNLPDPPEVYEHQVFKYLFIFHIILFEL